MAESKKKAAGSKKTTGAGSKKTAGTQSKKAAGAGPKKAAGGKKAAGAETKTSAATETKSPAVGAARRTTNPDKIRKWVEARGGKPSTVKGTGEGEPGVLRIDFPGYRGKQTLAEISWDDFFKKFEEQNLAFLYQDKTAAGKQSRFCKLVSRDRPAKKKSAAKSK